MPPYVLGEAWFAEAAYLKDRGLDSRASIERATSAYEEALRLDPTLVWVIHALSSVCGLCAVNDILAGRDPQPALDKALAYSGRGLELDSSSLPSRDGALFARLYQAWLMVEAGRDPESVVSLVRKGVEAEIAQSHDAPSADYCLSWTDWVTADHELSAGRDPSAAIDRGMKTAGGHAARSSSIQDSYEMLGRLGAVKGLYLLQKGEDPGPALRDAEAAFQRVAEGAPWDVGYRAWRARVESIGLRWAVKQHQATAESFRAVLAPLTPLLAEERVDPRLYLVLAEIHQIEAAWLLEGSKSADPAIAEGLAMADKALHLNPHMARALLTKGTLLLARADAARAAPERSQAALDAGEALSAAAKENPLLEREIAPLRLALRKVQAR